MVSQHQIDQAIVNHCTARADQHMSQKFLNNHGWHRCPYSCFEQEAGTGAFEVVDRSGWGVAPCPVCGGLGWVTLEVKEEFERVNGYWGRVYTRLSKPADGVPRMPVL